MNPEINPFLALHILSQGELNCLQGLLVHNFHIKENSFFLPFSGLCFLALPFHFRTVGNIVKLGGKAGQGTSRALFHSA